MTNHQNGLTEEEVDKEIHYPMFELLMANAKYRMKQRFKDYGNSCGGKIETRIVQLLENTKGEIGLT